MKAPPVDTNGKSPVWWDAPQGLSGPQLRRLIQLKNIEVLHDLVANPSRLGLSTHADPRKEQRKEAGEFVATAGVHDYYDTATLAEADQLRQAATKRGDFTPLTTAYKALGGMTVFDEMLVRQAIKSKIPDRLVSMENLHPNDRHKFWQLEKLLPTMNKELKTILSSNTRKEAAPTIAKTSPVPGRRKSFTPLGTLRTTSDGGFNSWRVFMKELRRCVNKVTRGRHLAEFINQSDEFMEKELNKLRLKSLVTFMYDSPHLGGVQHVVHSPSELKELIDSTDYETKDLEQKNFHAYLRWIDVLLTSISNIRLREILSWHTMSYDRVEEIRHYFDSEKLSRAPSITFQPKYRNQRSEYDDDINAESDTPSRVNRSKLNIKEQNQQLWRKFHRDKPAGKFDRPRPSGTDVEEWRFKGDPPWMEIISKVQTRFQAVKSELSMQTIAKKTQRKVNEENAEQLIRSIHGRWKKAEVAKRVKYEKFLKRKKVFGYLEEHAYSDTFMPKPEQLAVKRDKKRHKSFGKTERNQGPTTICNHGHISVFWTLRHPPWTDRGTQRKKVTTKEDSSYQKDKLRVNTWFPDLKDQCNTVLGSTRAMRVLDQFSAIPWDQYNFALERFALLLCSLSGSELTDFQMQSAARFVLREILAGPEDLINRCYQFRGISYRLPFLRPGRGESIIMESKPLLTDLADRKSRGKIGFVAEARAEYHVSASRKTNSPSDHQSGDESSRGGESQRPRMNLRGSIKPVHLDVRSQTPWSRNEPQQIK